MTFAVPVAAGRLSPHFGHCKEFALIDVNPQKKEVVGKETVPASPHQPGLLPYRLRRQGTNFIIAGGMGMRARQLFEHNRIEVLVGAPVEWAGEHSKSLSGGQPCNRGEPLRSPKRDLTVVKN